MTDNPIVHTEKLNCQGDNNITLTRFKDKTVILTLNSGKVVSSQMHLTWHDTEALYMVLARITDV